MNEKKELREWLFRGLLFEAEAEQFRTAGIRIGASQSGAERNLLDEVLAPFGIALRNDALYMARLYALIFCFENSVRSLIRERLEENEGVEWWDKAPQKVKKIAESRKKDALKNSWLEGQNKDILSFVEFGDLSSIIIENWEVFSDLIPSQHWLQQRFEELEKARNFIAHNRLLLPSEFQRIEMYIGDWNKLVGL
jgi:hypothetical protein